ncbi:MAG TPA: 2TM domain-containing protein [Solirubrobacterales bacterium]|nr:2TM domain-containing protein [Solirubrobacterales bacterium]
MNDAPTDVQDDARKQAIRRLKAKRDFKSFLGTAAIAIVVVIVVWALSDSDYFWPIWVILGLGIALFFSGLQAYGPHRGPITEAEIQREIDKGT